MLTLTLQTCVFEVQTLQRLGTPMGNVTLGQDYSNWVPSSIDWLKQCHSGFPRHRRVALVAVTRADAGQFTKTKLQDCGCLQET